ncbi:hypothetical protein FZ025_07945 [Xanthomonas hyacinthi]|uniref:hypothetical protein n=1 Tax=Xanthomonas hyacinthi TaxID=56455 RepID=UPI000A74ED75|nr:hypothetical protein [Xanthomonas hyacinthi]QGY76598.1 hypothetical protein FZ025_07945 [Xanthomonas hyacinthi]
MRWQLTVACAILGLGMALNSTAPAQEAPVDNEAALQVAAELSNNYAEQQKIARKNAKIHSSSGLTEYLAKNKTDDSPLNSLSPAARKRFIESLKFNENGVTSFYYADIESQLTSSQAYNLLSMFGLQTTLQFMHKLRVNSSNDQGIMSAYGSGSGSGSGGSISPGAPEDHNDYWCSGRATCSRNVGSICTGNC